MTTVEVLAPVRLETRFRPPDERPDGIPEWQLRVRIYPDEFSIRRIVRPPSAAELDRLTDSVTSLTADPPHDEAAAFASFAAAVGPARALGLWRSCVTVDAGGIATVDRSDEADPSHFAVHGPAGLPEQLEVWLILADGSRLAFRPLPVDLAGIGADLDLGKLEGDPGLVEGKLPATWWLSYERAVEVGLGIDIDLGADPPAIDALVTVGIGDTDAAVLVDAHNGGGRMGVLRTGTPTNTVEGEPTADFGDDADALQPLLHVDPSTQQSTRDVLVSLTGRVPTGALPMVVDAHDNWGSPGLLAVQAFWPVLWGRALRDVTVAGALELDLARWALRNLRVEGWHPAIRVGAQPYGLMATSVFDAWVADPQDDLADVEDRIRKWGIAWRSGAAAAARSADIRVVGADTDRLVEVLGLHAPSRHWRVRPIADLAVIQAARALAGMAPMPAGDWDRSTAASFGDRPYPGRPIGPAAHPGRVPGPPGDMIDDLDDLLELCFKHPEGLYFERGTDRGLVGHLFREVMIAQRAIVGEAIVAWDAGDPVELGHPLPLDDEDTYIRYVMAGDDRALEELRTSTDDNGANLAKRFDEVREALIMFHDLWPEFSDELFRAVLAAMDTAAFRADPWLTGIAERRLERMVAAGAPFRLGAYGWVDAPAPYQGVDGGPVAPGPTAAGLLHAPSHAQALTAALLRDAAVRFPDDERWNLTIDSAKVRASVALAERVRLGVHPYEALGLEVEKVAGDWDTVRILRREYPLASDQGERRVCDGARVLHEARAGTLAAGLPADLAARLAPLDDVLDTYADLLVADGMHALVTGRADLANAAMEAAAGLGAPPDLRSIRTPRAATTVRVSAWALLAPGDGGAPEASLVEVADPAFATLVTDQLGPGAPESADPAVRAARDRLAVVLGGGDDDPPVPSLTGGNHEALPADGAADVALRAAMASDLEARLVRLGDLAQAAHDQLVVLEPADADAADRLAAAAERWRLDLTAVVPADPEADDPSTEDRRIAAVAALAGRIEGAQKVAGTLAALGPGAPGPDEVVNRLRRAIRGLTGNRDLPVLAIVERSLLPVLRSTPDIDRTWLELVAAVHPRLAALEAHQFDPDRTSWPAAVAAPDASIDPWHSVGPVLVAYGPAVPDGPAGDVERVAIAALDAWTDSIPSRRHATTAAFGFNSPKSRAPQAVLLAVPPDPAIRLTSESLVDLVLETRELAHARAGRPTDRGGLPYSTPSALVHAAESVSFLAGWNT